jgi:hypothetical protein
MGGGEENMLGRVKRAFWYVENIADATR